MTRHHANPEKEGNLSPIFQSASALCRLIGGLPIFGPLTWYLLAQLASRKEREKKASANPVLLQCSNCPLAIGLSAVQRLLQKQYCCMHCFRLSVQLATVSWCTVPPWFQGQASLPLPAFYGISLFTTYRTSLQFNKLVQLRQGLITESEGQAKKAEIDELGFFSLNSESCRLKQFERLHPWLFISPFILNPSTRWTMHDLKR